MSVPSRPLTNDSLGKKGERRFGEMCDDAGLVANSADYDRGGWDYIVDFRYPATKVGLDERPSPPSARVQVKTHWSDRDLIKVRLSAAEQIAKHPGPSFFCVLSVDSSLAFSGMRLLHCRGEVLERILKRLREAEAEGRKPNEVWVTLRPSDFAEALEPTGKALKDALEAACGPATLAYVSEKDTELRTLGFENGGIRVQLELSGDEDSILDGFLGLRALDAKTFNVTSTRFGVELPVENGPTGPGVVRFEPRGDRCRLVFKTASRRFEFSARSFRAPGLVTASVSKAKVRIVADTFSLVITTLAADEDVTTVNYSFAMNETAFEGARKVKDWDSLYGAFDSITDQGVEMEIHSGKKRVFKQFIKVEREDEGNLRALARIAEAAAFVFEEGGAPNAKVSLENVWDAQSELLTLAAMSREPESVTGLSFTTEASVPLPREAPFQMMLGHTFRVGDHILAFTAALEVAGEEEGTNWRWTSETVDLRKIRRVRSETELNALFDASPRRPYRVVTGVWQAPRPVISKLEEKPEGSRRSNPFV